VGQAKFDLPYLWLTKKQEEHHASGALLAFSRSRAELPQHIRKAYVHGCAEKNPLTQDSFRRVCFVGTAAIWALPKTTNIAKRPQSSGRMRADGKDVCFCPKGANGHRNAQRKPSVKIRQVGL